MLSKGQKINDRYEIVKSIGDGGMANVYLAKDEILERKVAIKVLRGDLAKDDKFIRRFNREALSVSNLSHPNIVEVYDVGEENGEHYIVMEYIEGKTLKQLLNKRNNLTLNEVIDIMTQLTDGIAHAHEAYIIHRDIKPQNIMILDDGKIKITDFGIAIAMNATQFTQTNSVMGSVYYIPPEQANGKSSTIKSDIYSMGIMMYELLTGTVPFKGDNAVEIALKHMKEKIPSVRKQNPAIPQSIENIILKSTAKNPRNRYDNVREMYNDLVESLSEEHENDKRVVYKYPENDLDETKVITKLEEPKKEKTIEPVSENDNVDDKIDKKSKLPIILISIIIFFAIAFCVFFLFLNKSNNSKDIIVPNIVGMDIDDGLELLKKKGFKYTTVTEDSDTVEEGLIIRTTPKAGSSKVKGSTITVYESLGEEFIVLEDYTDQNINKVQAKLEVLGIKVTVDKKDVDDPKKYKGKEDIIIGQSIEFKKDEEKKLTKGDSIILYVPNIVNTYPDMIGESWNLSDVKAFVEEYGITLAVIFVDQNGKTVNIVDNGEFDDSLITYQSRGAGDTIVSGITLKVKALVNIDTTLEDAGVLPTEEEKTE